MTEAAMASYGNRQAGILCNMACASRLDLLAAGFPIMLASSQGFWVASRQLEGCHREANVLIGFAEEEAAKILILMDLVRCPGKKIARRVGRIVRTFYDHLSRLIYADAQNWKPMNVAQLRDYVDNAREGHYLEGYIGEYIVPNWSRYSRESEMYADIELGEDREPRWNDPAQFAIPSLPYAPRALELAEAMGAVGMFDRRGLQAISDIWNEVDFVDQENHEDSRRLTGALFKRLTELKLVSETAMEAHGRGLFNDWQMPMYDLEFREQPISFDDLNAQREANMWIEAGYDPSDY